MLDHSPRGIQTLDLIRDQNLAYQKYLIVFTSLMVWDWLSLLRTEYRHVYRAKRSFSKICYLLKCVDSLSSNEIVLTFPSCDSRYGTIALVIIYTTLALAPVSPGPLESSYLSQFRLLTKVSFVEVCRRIFWLETLALIYVVLWVVQSYYGTEPD